MQSNKEYNKLLLSGKCRILELWSWYNDIFRFVPDKKSQQNLYKNIEELEKFLNTQMSKSFKHRSIIESQAPPPSQLTQADATSIEQGQTPTQVVALSSLNATSTPSIERNAEKNASTYENENIQSNNNQILTTLMDTNQNNNDLLNHGAEKTTDISLDADLLTLLSDANSNANAGHSQNQTTSSQAAAQTPYNASFYRDFFKMTFRSYEHFESNLETWRTMFNQPKLAKKDSHKFRKKSYTPDVFKHLDDVYKYSYVTFACKSFATNNCKFRFVLKYDDKKKGLVISEKAQFVIEHAHQAKKSANETTNANNTSVNSSSVRSLMDH